MTCLRGRDASHNAFTCPGPALREAGAPAVDEKPKVRPHNVVRNFLHTAEHDAELSLCINQKMLT